MIRERPGDTRGGGAMVGRQGLWPEPDETERPQHKPLMVALGIFALLVLSLPCWRHHSRG